MDSNETILNENKFTLTPEEMELSKNPESFKIYLEYKARIQETMFAEAGKQRDKEFESLNLQREREFELSKYQSDKEFELSKYQSDKEFELTKYQRECEFELTKYQREREADNMKWQREKEAETIKMIDQRRKDAWAVILGVGAALVENFCENNSNSQITDESVPIEASNDDNGIDPITPVV